MSDLYAVSADKPGGGVVTHFFPQALAESMIDQGWRVSTQSEIDATIKNLPNDPMLGYYRETSERRDYLPLSNMTNLLRGYRKVTGYTPAITQADVDNWTRENPTEKWLASNPGKTTQDYDAVLDSLVHPKAVEGSADKVMKANMTQLEKFAASVGATGVDLARGTVTGGRQLTLREQREFQKVSTAYNKAALEKVQAQQQYDWAMAGPTIGGTKMKGGYGELVSYAVPEGPLVEPIGGWGSVVLDEGITDYAYKRKGYSAEQIAQIRDIQKNKEAYLASKAHTPSGYYAVNMIGSDGKTVVKGVIRELGQHKTLLGMGYTEIPGTEQELRSGVQKAAVKEAVRSGNSGGGAASFSVEERAPKDEEAVSSVSGGMRVSGWYPITRPVGSSRRVEGLPQSHGRPWVKSVR